MTHRCVDVFLVLAVAGAAACGSTAPAKTPEPSEPARSVSTATAEPTPPPPDGLDPRVVAMVQLMEKLIAALERAGGDCDRAVAAIAAFAQSEDGVEMRRFARDDTLAALGKAQADAVKAAYPTLDTRFVAALTACPDQGKISAALDDSKIFVKRRDDGTVVED